MQGNTGYSSNRNVRTASNGRRASHGYNYTLLLQHCVEVNKNIPVRPKSKMYSSVEEAFASSGRKKR